MTPDITPAGLKWVGPIAARQEGLCAGVLCFCPLSLPGGQSELQELLLLRRGLSCWGGRLQGSQQGWRSSHTHTHTALLPWSTYLQKPLPETGELHI